MGLNLWEWLKSRTTKEPAAKVADITAEEVWELTAELYVRELAFWTCANFLGDAISQCEFKTFINGKEKKGSEFFLWNYEPNKNQNSSEFIHKWITKLCQNNEALIVESNGALLVADSYSRQKYALVDDVFSEVTVGDFTFQRSFCQSDVIFVQRHEQNVKRLVDNIYFMYQKLIDYGMRSYQKSRGTKGTLELDMTAMGDKAFNDVWKELQNSEFKKFAVAENALLPLYKGMTYTDIGSKTYSNESTRDIRAMIDDVFDFTAKAFGIHPAIFSGNVTGNSEAVNATMTFAVDPLAKTLEKEINRKRNGKEGIMNGNYLKIDTGTIQHIDPIGKAESIDKLISSGVYCVNELRIMLGNTAIEEDWAWKHFITKNYAGFDSALDEIKGDNQK